MAEPKTQPRTPFEVVVDNTTSAVEAVRDAATPPWTVGNRVIGYDPQRKRLWVAGQRLHHGATGIAVAGAGLAGAVARRTPLGRALVYTLAGGLLMAHDWKDRSVWFQRGPQADPSGSDGVSRRD